MKKLDIATLAGLLGGFGFILLGNYLEGGHVSSILQPTAALIVFGGTLGAVMVSFPMGAVLSAVKALRQFFGNSAEDPKALVDEIVRFANLARKEGILALEAEVEKIKDPFLKKAILMVVDGFDSKAVQETLELELNELDEQGEIPAKVWEAGGGYSPTIGIIGAVLGLIHVMSNLSDIDKVGSGIAVAFVATIYGVAGANIVFLPAANKLKLKHRQQMILREIAFHGVLGIQQGQNQRLITTRLSAYLHGHGDAHGAVGEAKSTKAAA